MENQTTGTVPMNMWQRMAGVLVTGPRAAFEDIAAKPYFAGMLIFNIAATLLLTLPMLPKIQEFTLLMMQKNLKQHSVPGDAAAALNMAASGAVVATLAGALLGPVVMWLITAALLKLFNSFAGEKAAFKQLFAVSVYAYLPVLLAAMIQTGLIMVTPAANMIKVSTGLSLLLPPDATGPLAGIAGQIDPFSIWNVYLLSLGGAVAMNTRVKKVAIYMYSLWLVYVIITGLIASTRSM